MKKFGALLCTAALSFSMAATALANPSIVKIASENVVAATESATVTQADGTVVAAEVPETLHVDVIDVDTTRYTEKYAGTEYEESAAKVAEVVEKVNDTEKEYLNVVQVLTTLATENSLTVVEKEDGTVEFRTEEDEVAEIKTVNTEKVIDPAEYEPLTYIEDLVLTDDENTEVEYDLNGEVVSVKVTLTVEALKETDVADLLVMQINPKTGEIYFIEISEDDFDPETGDVTVEFPCLGPFCFISKEAAAELQSEAVTEAATEAVTEAQ